MGDDRARDLERAALRTGSLIDRAAALRARTRSGDLLPERLELAAYLGHDAALAAIGWSCRDAQGCNLAGSPNWCRACAWRDASIAHWARGLSRLGRECCVRVAVKAARSAQATGCDHSVALLDRALSLFGHARVCARCEADERVLAAVEAWVNCPCEAHEADLRSVPQTVSLWAYGSAAIALHPDLDGLATCLTMCAAKAKANVAFCDAFHSGYRDAVAAWALA
jgi:hypothetical protein